MIVIHDEVESLDIYGYLVAQPTKEYTIQMLMEQLEELM
jgi:hypothetical protein